MLTSEQTTKAATTPETPETGSLLNPEPGGVLDGRFLILELLKEGGTSQVLKATDLESGDLVALKVPKAHFAVDTEFLERFRREEDIGLRVRHPYLVAMRAVQEKSRPYLAMEFVKGETLAQRLTSGMRPSVPEAVRIACMVLEGLEELHRQGVIHRDITAQNVILCDDGTIRIMDYGIASVDTDKGRPSSEEWIWGTPAYMAPEQVRNLKANARTDVYSLGILLYEMLAGTVPFTGDDPIEVMNARLSEEPIRLSTFKPELPSNLEKVVSRAIRKDPQERYRSAKAMARELQPLLEDWIVDPVRLRRSRGGERWGWRTWAQIAAVIVAMALVAKAWFQLSWI